MVWSSLNTQPLKLHQVTKGGALVEWIESRALNLSCITASLWAKSKVYGQDLKRQKDSLGICQVLNSILLPFPCYSQAEKLSSSSPGLYYLSYIICMFLQGLWWDVLPMRFSFYARSFQTRNTDGSFQCFQRSFQWKIQSSVVLPQ